MADQHSVQDPYHNGERAVQARAGVRAEAQRVAEMVQPTLSENMRAFLSHQPFAVAAFADNDGRVWTSLLAGEPGFMMAPTDGRVRIDCSLLPGDPLAEHQCSGMYMGLLVIDPRDRSRLRINGVVSLTNTKIFALETSEVYPNCQKYIQRRSLEQVSESSNGQSIVTRRQGLTASHRDWIREADTFFIGSVYPDRGADASHRGGAPGFIDVSGETLVFPDYPGNNMFCTLGNLTTNSNTGLLFIDFETGRTLQLTGDAEVIWDETRLAAYDRAERLVEVTVAESIETDDGNPLRWRLEEQSPFNP